MNERIKLVRKRLKLTQNEFASKIGIAGSTISDIEKGKSNLTERNITLICEKFNVNEEWLKTGNGDMFVEPLLEDELSAFLGDILGGDDEFIKKYILTYMKLKDEQKQALDALVKTFVEQNEKDNKKSR